MCRKRPDRTLFTLPTKWVQQKGGNKPAFLEDKSQKKCKRFIFDYKIIVTKVLFPFPSFFCGEVRLIGRLPLRFLFPFSSFSNEKYLSAHKRSLSVKRHELLFFLIAPRRACVWREEWILSIKWHDILGTAAVTFISFFLIRSRLNFTQCETSSLFVRWGLFENGIIKACERSCAIPERELIYSRRESVDERLAGMCPWLAKRDERGELESPPSPPDDSLSSRNATHAGPSRLHSPYVLFCDFILDSRLFRQEDNSFPPTHDNTLDCGFLRDNPPLQLCRKSLGNSEREIISVATRCSHAT